MSLLQSAANGLVLIGAIPVTGSCAYLSLLTLLSVRGRRVAPRDATTFFDVIVPAHDEGKGVAATIDNLHALDWPAARFRVVVVADNCSDDTAEVARRHSAVVLERRNDALRGKGYALEHAFAWSAADGQADAVVVVDADTIASRNLLQAFAARIERGEHAMQAHYGVLNVAASWRTRLMAIALGAIHKLRSRAREFLGLSCGIRGNGWCLTHAALRAVPYRAFSLAEDVEFGVELGLAGHRVAYCDEADVDGEMVTSERAARSQRQRWEAGRFELIRQMTPRLFARTLARGDKVCLDLCLDLLIFPLSYIVAAGLVLLVAALALGAHAPAFLPWIAAGNLVALCLYVLRGWQLSGVGPAGFFDLLRVPQYMAWKIVLQLLRRKPKGWVRTQREDG